MSITLILQAIIAALRFPTELAAFIRLIEKTPEEKRQEITNMVNAQYDKVAAGERPQWD